jgi:hypothetical protein
LLRAKNANFSQNFSAKIFKNHNIGPRPSPGFRVAVGAAAAVARPGAVEEGQLSHAAAAARPPDPVEVVRVDGERRAQWREQPWSIPNLFYYIIILCYYYILSYIKFIEKASLHEQHHATQSCLPLSVFIHTYLHTYLTFERNVYLRIARKILLF